ncbi:MAG TPA: LysE family transporter [Solirubrobacteraceae bacterium]|jgi:L-lysine exporter family protein LysE/ArgO|nr:LysE family transporter [Solirubrobacteraceae bacterium]
MSAAPEWTTALAGFLFSLSLIVAIGAQNSFVLRQGALREHIGTVVAICSVSDVVLIAAGVAGVGAALAGRPWLLDAVRWLGVAALLAYGALAARRALRGPVDAAGARRPAAGSRPAVMAACLAFTWLNPAVYLDTLILLGSVANAHPGRQWWFAAGASAGSVGWFIALGFGARALSGVLSRPAAWRGLDGFVAVVMVITAVRVLLAA